jgi:hypothetical protein
VRSVLAPTGSRSTPGLDATSDVLRHPERLGLPSGMVPCDPPVADTAALRAASGYPQEDSANPIVAGGRAGPPRRAGCVRLAPGRLDMHRTGRQRVDVRRASYTCREKIRALAGMDIGRGVGFGRPERLLV